MSSPLAFMKLPSKISWAIPHAEVVGVCVLELLLWVRGGGLGEGSLGKCGGSGVCVGTGNSQNATEGKLGQLCDGGEKVQVKRRCLCMPR